MVQKFDGWKPEPKPDWWMSRGPRWSGIPSSSSSFRQDAGRRASGRALNASTDRKRAFACVAFTVQAEAVR